MAPPPVGAPPRQKSEQSVALTPRPRPADASVGGTLDRSSQPAVLTRAHPSLLPLIGAALLGLALVLPAPVAGWTVSPGDLSWIRLPFSPFADTPLTGPKLQLASDWVDVFAPDQSWMTHQLLNGHLPLWSDAFFGGWPLFASQQTSMLSPFTWFVLVSTADGTTASIAAKVAVCALGTWALARRLGMSATAAAVSAVSFATGGYFLAWIFHPHTAVYAWMPWAAWGLLALLSVDRRPRHLAMCAGAFTLMWSAGHPQSAAISTAFCVTFAIYAGWRTRCSPRHTALPVLAVGAGIAGASVQLLPLVDLLSEAHNAKRGGVVGASPVSWLSLVVPNWWETPRLAPTPLPGLSNYFERTVYIGVAPLLLAGIGLLRSRHWLRPFLVAALLACLPFVLDLGTFSRVLVELPLLDRVSLPRVLIVVSLLLALLAGLGLDAVRERVGGRTVAVVATLVAAIAVLLVIVRPSAPGDLDLRLAWPWRTATDASDAASIALTHFLIAAAAALVLLVTAWRWPRTRNAMLVLVVVTATVDLVAHGRALLPLQTKREAQLQSTPAIERLQTLQGEDGRIAAGPPAVFHPNVPTQFGLRDIRGRGLPVPRRLVRAWHALEQPAATNQALFDPASPHIDRFLAFGDVRAVLVPHSAAPPGTMLDYAGPDGHVYRVTEPAGRATLVTTWQPAADEDQAVRLLRDATTEQITSRPVIETNRRGGEATIPARGSATLELVGANRVVVRTESAAPGFLVLRDTYMTGWRARVDGAPAEIVPANVAHRAVWVPAGTHTVEFAYLPTTLALGGLVSAVSWLVIAGVCLAMRRRRARHRRSEDRAMAARS